MNKLLINKTLLYSLLILAGIVTGVGGYALFSGVDKASDVATANDKKPLYWVAPMDPNYRRDKPGKSPMGMDLIPVYEEQQDKEQAGAVRISPAVENNLGVRTAEVKRDVLDAQIKTVGYVQYNEDRLVHIHPRVEGWIETLYVKAAGDPVAKGEPLYTLYSPALVTAQEELVLALGGGNSGGNTRLIRAAKARLRALQVAEDTIATLIETRKVNQTVTFYTPQSGVVDNLGVREGFFVKPGTTLMVIGVLEDIWVVGEVFARQADQVRVGDAVAMTLDYLPGGEWNGAVDYIYPSLNRDTRTVRLRIRFANDDRRLKPDMLAQLVISSRLADSALVIPHEALIRTGGRERVVLALGEGRFKSVAVQTGRRSGDRVEVISGLAEGDRIVVSAQFLLDSESSKTADLQRLDHRGQTHD